MHLSPSQNKIENGEIRRTKDALLAENLDIIRRTVLRAAGTHGTSHAVDTCVEEVSSEEHGEVAVTTGAATMDAEDVTIHVVEDSIGSETRTNKKQLVEYSTL